MKFIRVNYQPAVNEHLTPKVYVDNAIDEISLVSNVQDNDFNNYHSTNTSSITLHKQAANDNEVITTANVDQFHNDNEGSRQDLGLEVYNESSHLVKSIQNNDLYDNKTNKFR